MKQIYLLVFVLLSNLIMSQTSDDFEDGNFTENPEWTGDQQLFKVNSSFQLQLNDTTANQAYLSTTNSMMINTEWQCWLKLSFSPSGNNYARYYLVSDNDDAKISPEIGINYFILSANNIKSKYSVGLRGINLFARARYSVKIPLSTFLIEPVQTFKYSVKDEFYEDTYIYIDKQHVQSKLFRIILHRKTQSEIDGMDYGLSFQYYWDTFNIAQTFSGNTKYKYIGDETSTPPKTDESVIVNNYTTSMRFRQNIWKDWFFYEVGPSISFNNDKLYRPNYSLYFSIDMYFGNYQNSAY